MTLLFFLSRYCVLYIFWIYLIIFLIPSEYSNTESSEDIDQKQEVDELSEEDNLCYFDSRQSFSDCAFATSPKVRNANGGDLLPSLQTKRRTRLPDPIEKEKGISLWSIIKDNVGKDLTRVCLPVYFNEPLSSLQKCFEDLEYSYLLDRAYEYGKMVCFRLFRSFFFWRSVDRLSANNYLGFFFIVHCWCYYYLGLWIR